MAMLRTKFMLPNALFMATLPLPALAQEHDHAKMEHAQPAPAPAEPMDHGAMDHGAMDHGSDAPDSDEAVQYFGPNPRHLSGCSSFALAGGGF
ncbi:MAG: hypothetical protein RLZZ58_1129, partial [Pseudomonadota bacterium]